MDIKGKLETAEVDLVAIGSGSVLGAKHFVEKLHFTGEMYINPDLKAYKAFNLERGFLQTLGPASLIRGIKTMGEGFRQSRTDGDLWQQGGVFVIGPKDKLSFQHRNKSAGDHVDLHAVLAAIMV